MMHLKRGDTFAFYVEFRDEDGNPTIVDASLLKSQVRNDLDQLIAELVIEQLPDPGQFLFRCDDTTLWPLGELMYDIKFSVGGIVTSSATDTIEVFKDVTKYE